VYFQRLGCEAVKNRSESEVIVDHGAPAEVRRSLLEKQIARILVLPAQNGEKVYGLLFAFPPRDARDQDRLLRSLVSHLGTALSRSGELRELERLAFVDELTQIYSRSYWMEIGRAHV